MEERTRETQRLDKVLQDAGVKLSSVASDILGRSGRDMLDALMAGSRNPDVLAELARGRLRSKIAQLRAALTGRFGPNHGLVIGEILVHLDLPGRVLGAPGSRDRRTDSPFADARDRLATIPRRHRPFDHHAGERERRRPMLRAVPGPDRDANLG
jgi:transposase